MGQVLLRQIRATDIEGFHAARCTVARDRRRLATNELPPREHAVALATRSIDGGWPFIVALGGETLVGYCDVSPIPRKAAPHVGELGIAIVPEWRDRGIGRRLMIAALDAGWRYGFSRIQLSVYASNERAVALYRKMDFIEEGRLRRSVQVDGVFHDEILMAIVRD